MLDDIVEVEVIAPYSLALGFEDGTKAIVDISKLVPFKGVFVSQLVGRAQ